MKQNRQPVEVYLAARFSLKEELRERAKELEAVGVGVTSRWLQETAPSNSDLNNTPEAAQYYTDHARIDVNDIYDSDVVMLFTEDPLSATKRGGRHWEAGYAACLQHQFGKDSLMLVTVGPRENIFHYLPEFLNFPTWEEAKAWLVKLREERNAKGNSESVGSDSSDEEASVPAS